MDSSKIYETTIKSNDLLKMQSNVKSIMEWTYSQYAYAVLLEYK